MTTESVFDWVPTASDRPLSLPEQIAEKVGNAIIKGSFELGQRIQEQDLAERFQVSRGPIREALRILEKEGMVQILPRRGAQVTQLTIEEVNDVFEVRASLLGLAAKRLAGDPTPAALSEIGAKVDAVERISQTPDHDAYVSAVYRLNLLVAQASGNAHLRGIMFSLAHQTLRYSRLGLSTPERRRQSAGNWRRLFKAITAGDGAVAQQVAEQLVLQSRDTAVRMLREQQGPQRPVVGRLPARSAAKVPAAIPAAASLGRVRARAS